MGYRTYTCPIARTCGGCEWLAVPYPIQLRRKQEQVEELLAPQLAEDGCKLSPIVGMDEPLAFRHKAATPFAPGRKGSIRSGFYQSGSHRIVACEDCLTEAPGMRATLNDVARLAGRLHIPAYVEDQGTGVLRHAVLRAGWATDERLLVLVTNGERLPRAQRLVAGLLEAHPELTSIVQNVNERRTNAILGHRSITLHGPGTMRDRLLGCTFSIGATSFYQTNPAQTEVLYRLAVEGAGLEDGMRVLDAYCGTGTIGICAAHEARGEGKNVQVTGVEVVRQAVGAARANAQANGVADACSFVCGDATAHMAELTGASGRGRYDVILMDPPRAGSTPEFLSGVARLAPERVVYVSCNPVTLARDLVQLRKGGYRIARATPVDMFPHTKHAEMVVVLARSGA